MATPTQISALHDAVAGKAAVGSPTDGSTTADAAGTARARLTTRASAFIDDALGRGAPDAFDRSMTERSARQWVLDAIVTVVAILFVVIVHVGIDGRPVTGGALVVDLVCAPIAIVLLLFRRRWPVRVSGAIAVLSAVAPGIGFAAIIAAYAVGAYARPSTAKVMIGLLLVPIPIVSLLWPSASGDSGFWSDVIFGVLVGLGVGAWGLYAGARRELLATLEERAVRAESEQALRIDQARAAERTRIAREMHDVLAHRMSLLSVHAGALEFRSDAPPEEIAKAAGVIRATAHDALEELRTVIGVMRVGESLAGDGRNAATGAAGPAGGAPSPAPEPPQPTLPAVPHLVEEWQGAGARIELELDLARYETLPAAVGRTAYRLVQEALTNAGKHAPGAKVEVHVSGEPGDSLVVSVANPIGVGRPAFVIPGTGLGLVGLRERTELAGGVFAAGIDEDLRRFVLEARLPWPAA